MQKHQYLCQCGNNNFHLEDKPVYYGKERRVHAQLVCTKCHRSFDIQPCNTCGLHNGEVVPKEVSHS